MNIQSGGPINLHSFGVPSIQRPSSLLTGGGLYFLPEVTEVNWFKHKTDSRRDPYIQELKSLFGWQGYGMYFTLLEICCEKWRPGTPPEFEFHAQSLYRELGVQPKVFKRFSEHSQNVSKMFAEYKGNILKITIPNLLKIKDEYSRKSGQAPDNAPPKRKRQSKSNISPSLSSNSNKEGDSNNKKDVPPQIVIFREVTKAYPHKSLYERVIAAIGSAGVDDVRPYFNAWTERGYNPLNLSWLTDWFANRQIPSKNGPGATQPKNQFPGAKEVDICSCGSFRSASPKLDCPKCHGQGTHAKGL